VTLLVIGHDCCDYFLGGFSGSINLQVCIFQNYYRLVINTAKEFFSRFQEAYTIKEVNVVHSRLQNVLYKSTV
jgi:hypothetical protein